MPINELLASIGNKKMDRKDFLKFMVFAVASIVGLKNLLSLIGGVDLRQDLTMQKQPDSSRDGVGGYNGGRYNR